MTSGKFTGRNRAAARLTAGQVREIREAYDSGRKSQGQLSRDWGVSVNQIGRIVRREAWQDVAEIIPAEPPQGAIERLLRVQKEVEGVGEIERRMAEEVAAAKAEQTPGETRGDKLLEELSESVQERARRLLGDE